MKEILLETKIKNNRLHKLIFSKFESVTAFCLTIKIPAQECYALINLKISPYWIGGDRRGAPKLISQKIEAALERPVEWLFPVELYMRAMNGGPDRKRSIARYEMGLDQARSMALSSCVVPVEIGIEDKMLESGFGHSEAIKGALSILRAREKKVIELRFGLKDKNREGMTLDATAKRLNVSRECIRQIEAKAIRKLRHPSRSRLLRGLL